MDMHIGSRYLKGFNLATFNSYEMGIDDEDYYLINRVCVEVTVDDIAKCATLIILTEVEIVDMSETDEGHLEVPKDIYTMPFPENSKVRKEILRLAKKHITLLLASTSVLGW